MMGNSDEENVGIDIAKVALADRDIAATIVPDRAQSIDPALEKTVVRKIDRYYVPLMWVGYGLTYYDKAILGAAALFGMTTDLSLVLIDSSTTPPTRDTTRLSWATSLFYFGMLGGLYPLTFLLQRFPYPRVLPWVIITWGGIVMSTAGIKSYKTLYLQRFLLGFVESIIPTAFMTIVSGTYTQQEQALRQSWWFSATGGWTVIGGALNYGFSQIEADLRSWQYIYLFAGALTVIFGLACFSIPNSVGTAWFLTEEERKVAVERLRIGQTGVRCHKIKVEQILEALVDPKIWIITLMMAAAYIINGGVSGFGPLIVSTFGYTPLESILLQFPLGAICFIFILLSGWVSARFKDARIIQMVIYSLPVITGCAMIWASDWSNRAIPVAGYQIIGFFGPVVGLIISTGMANVAGATKKSFLAASIFVAYCVGNIVGPLLVKSQTVKQHYPALWTGVIVCYCIVIFLCGILYAILRLENRRRDKMDGLGEEERDRMAFLDLTDRKNIYFRYVL
ncbi:hypothetical protein TWF730_011359 [Orbilia blumenaviensis]|uniref:Major facilitator superfamily (MFS) profile domain-containing protein n=1 Tax=Orbilia blumenaviensis TaxID=1796055 RepID=A0AAV9UNV8_9PEZI